ncbi:MAG: CatA-like O-acetyltransferase, family 3 [Bacteroidales bacterium]|nr:CatA-like O-acetyltransferase, family 3 [Eubacteriales bacterium]MDD4670006.1 CatA-like O-acetyltransferase, family 3 [Bacteroidales bacterium]
MNNSHYTVIDLDDYYRKGPYKRFTEIAKCSVSITHKIDVTPLIEYSKRTGTKFYINFLYLLAKVMNSRDDYKMAYLWREDKLVLFDQINPCQYVFHNDTETCTPVYTIYYPEYSHFYEDCVKDIDDAKATRQYGFDMINHPNWFDASYISWISYDSLNIELPDGHLYFQPIVNWGKYRQEGDRYLMPVSVRMNHAVADGYLISKVFLLLEAEILQFAKS